MIQPSKTCVCTHPENEHKNAVYPGVIIKNQGICSHSGCHCNGFIPSNFVEIMDEQFDILDEDEENDQ